MDYVSFHALLHPDKPAVTDLTFERRWSYEQFDRFVAGCTAVLMDEGVVEGDRVACLSKNRAEIVALHLACARLCAVFVPLNWRLSLSELAAIVSDCEPVIVYGDDMALALGVDAADIEGLHDRCGDVRPVWPEKKSEDLPSLMLYTSGTTGRPKGVMLSERNLTETVLLRAHSPAATQNNATSTTGASTLSLRGLGPNRTLVLIDGRRATPVNAQMVVDTNSIPPSAIERVEVVTGGASAVYGADAVAGVVNIILKDDFEGFEITSQYGITEEGDGIEFRFAPFFGASFDDDRGNVMVGLSYGKREEVWERDRSWIREDWADPNIGGGSNWQTDTFLRAEPFDFNGDGIIFQRSESNRPTQSAVDAIFTEAAGLVDPGAVFSVSPDGTVYTGAQILGRTDSDGAYRWPGMQNGGFELKDGAVFRKMSSDGAIRQNSIHQMLSIPLERYSMFARGRYDLTDNISAIGQVTYASTETTTMFDFTAAVNSWGAQVPHGDEIYAPSLNRDGTTNSAYLPGGRIGVNCPPVGGCTNSQAWPLPPELEFLMDSRRSPRGQDGSNAPVAFGKALDFVPPRTNNNQVRTFQFVVGLEGDLPNLDWTWDAHVSHGETTSTIINENFVPLENYRAIVQSPNFGQGAFIRGNEEQGSFAAGEAQCTSGLPIFRDFEVSQDCIDAITADLTSNSVMEQNVFEANIQGPVLEMPAGDLALALGYHHRENTYRYITNFTGDQFNIANQIVGLFPLGSSEGSIAANEVYAEALVPIIGDLPGIQDLTLELGVRSSDYDTIGHVITHKALVDWSLTDFARFRGGVQKANRAPNIAELFLARTQEANFEQFGDQCSENNISPVSPNPEINSPEQVTQSLAICRALMGEAGADAYYSQPIPLQPRSRGRSITMLNSVGNPDVMDEQADSVTFGLVFDSPWSNAWLDGLRASIDWYDVELTDMIARGNQDTTFIRCLSVELNPTGDPNDPNCQRLNRNPIDGSLAPTNVTFTNEGRAHTRGYDVQLNWTLQFPEIGLGAGREGISVRLLANFLEKWETQAAPDVEPIDWVGTSGSALGLQGGAYDWRTYTTISYFKNDLRISLRWRHLPEINAPSEALEANPSIQPVEGYDRFDLRANWTINDEVRLHAGVENLLDELPPRGNIDLTDPLPGASRTTRRGFYDVLGRRYSLGFTMAF